MCNNNIFNRVVGLTRFLVGLLWLGSALAITPAYSANVTFTGTLLDVFVDTGSSVYAGASIGDPFSGNFVYGNSELQASSIYSEPNERNWSFVGGSFGGTITDGVTPTVGLGVGVNVENDWALNADEALLIGTLTGGPVSSGTLVDTWSVYSLTSGASYVLAPTPEDPLNENLVNGMDFGMGFISLGGSLYSGLGYQSLPPGLGDVNAGFFYIEEADAAGNTQFLALGKLTTSTAVVPVPAAVWLLGSGLLGLIGVARRRRHQRHISCVIGVVCFSVTFIGTLLASSDANALDLFAEKGPSFCGNTSKNLCFPLSSSSNVVLITETGGQSSIYDTTNGYSDPYHAPTAGFYSLDFDAIGTTTVDVQATRAGRIVRRKTIGNDEKDSYYPVVKNRPW